MNKKFMKALALLLSLTFILGLFAGCTKKEETNTPSVTTQEEEKNESDNKKAEVPAEKVKLRISTMFGGTDAATDVYKQSLADFMEQNSNVDIVDESMTSVGEEYRTKIRTDYASGNEPDIVFFYTAADAKPLIDTGKVMSYDEIWKDYPNVGKDITPGVKDAMKEADGKIYALPVTGFYEGLFVNKEMFEKNGLALPTDWASLEEAVKTLSANGIVPFAGPLGQSHYLIEHFVLAAGGAEDHKDVFANGVLPSWVEGFELIKKLYDMNAFSKDAISMDIEGAQNLFKQEKAAMILEGSWFIGGLSDDLKEKVTVIPMPSGPSGKKDPTAIVAGFSSGYYVSTSAYKDDSKQDAVMKLVDFLTNAKTIEKMAEANGGVPAAEVSVPGLSPVAKDGHAMTANAKQLNMPIDSRLQPKAFNHIVEQGTPYIAGGRKTSQEVLEEVMKLHLEE